MLAQLELLPPRASTMAAEVDYLFYFISLITGGVTVLVTLLLLYFCSAYRRRVEGEPTPRILGSIRLEMVWTISPLLIFLVFYGWGVKVYNTAMSPPPDAMEVFVVGKQWMWKLQHETGQREINALHVPVGRTVKLTMTSEDVIHSFGVPAFRFKVDVLPGRYTGTWFKATEVGEYHLFCNQYCGLGHSRMVGTVYVTSQADYDAWLDGQNKETESPGRNAVDGSLAWEGRKLFLKLQCITCHSNNSRARAPVLEGTWDTEVPLQGGGTQRVNLSYVRESIRFPRAKIHQGWDPIMPAFGPDQVSEEDIIAVAAFIKSLRRGGTPDRTEDFPAPVGAPTEPKGKAEPKGKEQGKQPKEVKQPKEEGKKPQEPKKPREEK